MKQKTIQAESLPLLTKNISETTVSWSDEEFGAYMRLLIYQWSHNKIPKEFSRLNKIAESAEKNWELIGSKFEDIGNGLQNKVMELIRGGRKEFHDKQKNNGKKGGNPNFKKGDKNPYYNPEKITQDNPKDNPTHYPKDNPTKKRKKKSDQKPINNIVIPPTFTFEESELFVPIKFKEKMPSDWAKEKLRFYYNACLQHSKEENKCVDWYDTVQKWEQEDKSNGIIDYSVPRPSAEKEIILTIVEEIELLPFQSKKFEEAWNSLKKQKKWKKKSIEALSTALKKLGTYSEEEAIQMMEDTIIGDYQGLFESKNSKFNKSQSNGNGLTKAQQNIENMKKGKAEVDALVEALQIKEQQARQNG